MTWRIVPIDPAPFRPLFDLDEAALTTLGARRMRVETPNSAPCRVGLEDARPGETLILASHVHVTEPSSPYRGAGPVFVRQGAVAARPRAGEVPDMIGRRSLSARAYDSTAMMIDADVVEGADLSGRLDAWFADAAVDQVQVHKARRGCYLARAVRTE